MPMELLHAAVMRRDVSDDAEQVSGIVVVQMEVSQFVAILLMVTAASFRADEMGMVNSIVQQTHNEMHAMAAQMDLVEA